ncbi:methyltransferase-like protein 27 [Tachypleus tridentatus]|uniref:methyltransferase-like protein 27 n=1 Tax=Tachypleus tridentatus TaxID=6853 RepID=UPI003FCFE8F7
MAKEFEKLNVPKDAKLIDLAAGTGALGKELKALGYSCIDALDGTKGMLEVAKKKNIYRNLFQFFLGCEDKSPISEGKVSKLLRFCFLYSESLIFSSASLLMKMLTERGRTW